MVVKLPDFSYEQKLWREGYKLVAGADEVGRGSFAGPVVAACVIFPKFFVHEFSKLSDLPLINDSKKLSSLGREKANIWIQNNSLVWGLGEASVYEINKFGMGKASQKAFRRAIMSTNRKLNKINSAIEFILLDAFYIPFTKGLTKKNQNPIIKGDQKSFSIAAASIIAKVYRDHHMVHLNELPLYKVYKWDKNKGYGTKGHQQAIQKHGTSDYHRKQFVETFLTRINKKNS